MTLWIVLTIMTALAAVAAAAPFLRRLDQPRSQPDEDTGVYRDQLEEIAREERSGLIRPVEAVEARKEISRRLLTADNAAKSRVQTQAAGDRTFAAIGVASAVAIGSTILYANMGWPDLPSQPAGMRSARAIPDGGPADQATTDQSQAGQENAAGTTSANGAGDQDKQAAGTIDAMIERLSKRLTENPNNPDGWRMLGWSYFSQERYAESATAYAKAIEQNPTIGPLKTARGEALVRAGSGAVTDEAAGLFEEALKQDAKDPRARFFLGLKKEQAGAKPAALDDWISVLNAANPDEPWFADLKERVTALAGELKVDLAGRLTAKEQAPPARGGILDAIQSPDGATQPPAAADNGPNAEAVKKAEAMTPADRAAMIRGMVEGLEARLEKSPRDADGWIKLIRSRKVLGDEAAAKSALEKATAAFADAPDEKSRISDAAKEMGVTN